MKNLLMIIFVGILIVLYAGCTGEEKEKEVKSKIDSTDVDSVEMVEINEDVEYFMGLEGVAFDFPVEVDSSFMTAVQETGAGMELNTERVKLLSANMADNVLNEETEWGLRNFYFIDSLKVNKKYKKYVDNIDIGMVKYAEAMYLGRADFDESNSMIVWMVSHSSYEACPYFSGIMIMGTMIRDGEIAGCSLLGEEMSGGDAPVGMLRYVFSEIRSNGKGTLYKYEEHTGENEEGELVEEKSEDNFKLKIEDGFFVVK
jgi:hypothetical protein